MEFLKQSFFKKVSKGFNLTVSKIPLQKLIYLQRLRILEYFIIGTLKIKVNLSNVLIIWNYSLLL
jgi:hypothetical protein